jgi:hypothetical protein
MPVTLAGVGNGVALALKQVTRQRVAEALQQIRLLRRRFQIGDRLAALIGVGPHLLLHAQRDRLAHVGYAQHPPRVE